MNMNKIIEIIKRHSLIIIPTLLLLLVMSHCSKNKYKNIIDRYLITSTSRDIELENYIDSLLKDQTVKILQLEKEYDSVDSTIFNLNKKLKNLNVSE